jgi:hypothetical protein
MNKKKEIKAARRPALPSENELVRMPILLTKVQALRLRAAAMENGTTVSDLVRAAVDRHLAAANPGAPTLSKKDLENLFKDR